MDGSFGRRFDLHKERRHHRVGQYRICCSKSQWKPSRWLWNHSCCRREIAICKNRRQRTVDSSEETTSPPLFFVSQRNEWMNEVRWPNREISWTRVSNYWTNHCHTDLFSARIRIFITGSAEIFRRKMISRILKGGQWDRWMNGVKLIGWDEHMHWNVKVTVGTFLHALASTNEGIICCFLDQSMLMNRSLTRVLCDWYS